ncbi:hypothetical protein KSD_49970 [Ktedonobacter sp. SOSP1-85]|uniref:hypothetical protein n=1 Tax=Ktedonobacter sp. SOSP1-85 TaxID=2778367 RepID=UPI001A282DC7|nr:hypothetical protein [Ktedonobacter sp. SOSP1-85]GHO77226.1 hypothetical protein KSD_49970 [Ktedonobacter sp. SOSP1-85]
MTTHHQQEEHAPCSLIHLATDTASQQREIEVWGEDELEENEPLLLLLEALANPIRFHLLRLIAQEGGTCVSMSWSNGFHAASLPFHIICASYSSQGSWG